MAPVKLSGIAPSQDRLAVRTPPPPERPTPAECRLTRSVGAFETDGGFADSAVWQCSRCHKPPQGAAQLPRQCHDAKAAAATTARAKAGLIPR